ncbi:MAG: hypothetical protein ACXVAI_03270 [Candidatus Limnocylindrales bacterium]
MVEVTVIIFHPRQPAAGALGSLLEAARDRLVEIQGRLFLGAGAADVRVEEDRRGSFGRALALAAANLAGRGLIVLGAGAVPRLRLADARRLVAAAASGERRALTNNHYSSDVCAVGDSRALADLPALPADNALPRWLAERGGFEVDELPARERLAFDLDTPLDLALLCLAPGTPGPLRRLARQAGLEVPRLAELRALAADPRRELLVAGRASSTTLRWLERNTACRIRFLAEERGLRAASPLAQRRPSAHRRPPRTVLGRLVGHRGPAGLGGLIAELADGAVVDSRTLLADQLGPDESAWPSAEDRFASDLLRPEGIEDPWLRTLTTSAATGTLPILLGGHTLVGPGLPFALGVQTATRRRPSRARP